MPLRPKRLSAERLSHPDVPRSYAGIACRRRPLHPSRRIWSLALPVLGQNALAMLVMWSDTILVGQVLGDPAYVAAIVVAGYVLWFLESCAAVIAVGVQAVLARLSGAGAVDEINRLLPQALGAALALGTLLTFATWAGAPTAAVWLNLHDRSGAAMVEYLGWIAWSLPLLMVLLVGLAAMRAVGRTAPGFRIEIVMNAVNVAVSWGLIVGAGPLPELGWAGVGIGTACGLAVGGLLTLATLARGVGELRLTSRHWFPHGARLRRLLRVGVPGAADQLAMVAGHLWYVAIIGGLGTVAVAAHGVAVRCESIAWLTADALAVAAATLVGQSLGQDLPRRARGAALWTLASAVAVLSLYGVAFFAAGRWLFAVFVSGPDADAIFGTGVPVLRLVAFAQPALATVIVLNGALRGAGDTRVQLLFNAGGLLAVRIPLAYLLADFYGMGLYGAWLAMVFDLYVRAALVVWRFRSGVWSRLTV